MTLEREEEFWGCRTVSRGAWERGFVSNDYFASHQNRRADRQIATTSPFKETHRISFKKIYKIQRMTFEMDLKPLLARESRNTCFSVLRTRSFRLGVVAALDRSQPQNFFAQLAMVLVLTRIPARPPIEQCQWSFKQHAVLGFNRFQVLGPITLLAFHGAVTNGSASTARFELLLGFAEFAVAVVEDDREGVLKGMVPACSPSNAAPKAPKSIPQPG